MLGIYIRRLFHNEVILIRLHAHECANFVKFGASSTMIMYTVNHEKIPLNLEKIVTQL